MCYSPSCPGRREGEETPQLGGCGRKGCLCGFPGRDPETETECSLLGVKGNREEREAYERCSIKQATLGATEAPGGQDEPRLPRCGWARGEIDPPPPSPLLLGCSWGTHSLACGLWPAGAGEAPQVPVLQWEVQRGHGPHPETVPGSRKREATVRVVGHGLSVRPLSLSRSTTFPSRPRLHPALPELCRGTGTAERWTLMVGARLTRSEACSLLWPGRDSWPFLGDLASPQFSVALWLSWGLGAGHRVPAVGTRSAVCAHPLRQTEAAASWAQHREAAPWSRRPYVMAFPSGLCRWSPPRGWT